MIQRHALVGGLFALLLLLAAPCARAAFRISSPDTSTSSSNAPGNWDTQTLWILANARSDSGVLPVT